MTLSAPIETPDLTPQPSAVLEVQGLTKVFRVGQGSKTIRAVDDVSFTIARGEVLGLVGESGSGKSTIARLISRLHLPSSGIVRLSGQKIPLKLSGARLRRFRGRVQMIFQDPFSSLNPLLTVGYIVSRPLQIHGRTGGNLKATVSQLLERVGLSPAQTYLNKRPHELSGGQRQRVGIARALAAGPDLILADEPTSMLDVSIRLDIMNLLLELKDREGVGLLFITHDLAGARYMSDRIAVMYAGRIVEIGDSRAIIESPQHPYTQLHKAAAPKPELSLALETGGRIETQGEVPDLSQLPPGCPFAPRCPHRRPECDREVPAFRKTPSGSEARCILYDGAS